MTRFVESTITFPYRRSLGPVIGAFMTALTDSGSSGSATATRVLVPPMEWDPATGAELAHELVEVGPGRHGRVVDLGPRPAEQHPLDRAVRLCFHPPRRGLDAAAARRRRRLAGRACPTGMRVAPRWRGARIGRINDIVCFVPGEEPEVEGDDARRRGRTGDR